MPSLQPITPEMVTQESINELIDNLTKGNVWSTLADILSIARQKHISLDQEYADDLLEEAISSGNSFWTQKLVEEWHADVNHRTSDDETMLELALYASPTFTNDSLITFKMLIANGAAPNEPTSPSNGLSHLDTVIWGTPSTSHIDPAFLEALLAAPNIDINLPSDREETAFCSAMRKQDEEKIELLLKAGADISITPSYRTINYSDSPSANLANTLFEKRPPRTALELLTLAIFLLDLKEKAPLILPAKKKGITAWEHIDNFQCQALTDLANSLAIGDPAHLISEALRNEQMDLGPMSMDITDAILQGKLPVLAFSESGDSIFHQIAKWSPSAKETIHAVEHYLKQHLDDKFEMDISSADLLPLLINRANNSGDTPLHIAVRERNIDAVSSLLKRKAQNLANEDGHTPLATALFFGDVKIGKLFIAPDKPELTEKDKEWLAPLVIPSQRKNSPYNQQVRTFLMKNGYEEDITQMAEILERKRMGLPNDFIGYSGLNDSAYYPTTPGAKR